MKKINTSIIPFFAFVLLLQIVGTIPSHAYSSSDHLLEESATLTIRVISDCSNGEEGETSIVFSIEELIERAYCEDDYTFIDPDDGVIIDHAMGVSLHTLLSEAKIDTETIEELVFLSDEAQLVLSASDLLDTDRYCYFGLPDHYADGSYLLDTSVTFFCQKVEPILAVKDHWMPVSEGGMFWSNPTDMTDENAVRLVFGQSDISEQKANAALCRIHTIEVVINEQGSSASDTTPIGEQRIPSTNNPELSENTGRLKDDPDTFADRMEQGSEININIQDADGDKQAAQPNTIVLLGTTDDTGLQSHYTFEPEPVEQTIFQIQSQPVNQQKRSTLPKQSFGTVALDAENIRSVQSTVRKDQLASEESSPVTEMKATPESNIISPTDAVSPALEIGTDNNGEAPQYKLYELNLKDTHNPRLSEDYNIVFGQAILSNILNRLLLCAFLTGVGFMYYRHENRNHPKKE